MAEIFTNPFVKSGRNSVIDRRAYAGGLPQTVDLERMMNVQDPLLQMDAATPPTKDLPHQEYPKVVYKHPRRPYKKTEHYNVHHELVREEITPAEHLTKLVHSKAEEDDAIRAGWQLKPFVAPRLPEPDDDLYPADNEVETIHAEDKQSKRAKAENVAQAQNVQVYPQTEPAQPEPAVSSDGYSPVQVQTHDDFSAQLSGRAKRGK